MNQMIWEITLTEELSLPITVTTGINILSLANLLLSFIDCIQVVEEAPPLAVVQEESMGVGDAGPPHSDRVTERCLGDVENCDHCGNEPPL